MRKGLLSIFTIALGCATIASDLDWAKRIPCELQTAGSASLPNLELEQGTTPLIAADQYRSGRALTVTNDTVAYLRFAPSATNAYWVSTSNTSYSGSSYLIQLPSLGTNAVNWVYTVIYERNGNIYWTGRGRLDIKASTVTGSQLQWQQMAGAVTTNTVNDLISAHNLSTASHADKVSTNTTITVNGSTGQLSSNLTFTITSTQTNIDYVATAGVVVGSQSNTIATAWQNPASATNWTWVVNPDGLSVTLTSYNFSSLDVVIPDMLDGLPVTGFGGIFSPLSEGTQIASIVGGFNITEIDAVSFWNCTNLSSVSFASARTIGASCFVGCAKLSSASFPIAISIGNNAFQNCKLLSSAEFPAATTLGSACFLGCSGLPYLTLPSAVTIGAYAFSESAVSNVVLQGATTIGANAFDLCTNLKTVYWGKNQPTEPANLYANIAANQVTNYVTNPTATGWGSTFGGMPVVRMPIESERVNAGTVITIGALDVGGAINSTNLDARLLAKYDANNPSNFIDAASVTNIVAALQTANFVVNLTTNKLTGFTFAPTNATYWGSCDGTALSATASVSVPIGTNGNYAFAWGCTNTTFTSIEGSYVNGVLYCSENESGDMTAKVEIYRRDIATDTLTEWGDGGSTFTVPAGATPTAVPFSVYVPSVDTNSFRVWARIKRVGGTATAARLLIVGSGAGTTTHFAMTVPASAPIAAHNADLAAHPYIQSLIGASSGAPLAWTPISTLATGAVITVTPTQAKKVYKVSVEQPFTLTNNLATLAANCTTNFEWEVEINYTVTNALSTVWDSRIEWVGLYSSTPDLTVTGKYRFAFETACGTRIIGRQVYPTVYPWQTYEISALNVSVNAPSFSSFLESMVNTATNAYIYVKHPSPRNKIIFKPNFWASTAECNTTNVTLYIRTGGSTETSTIGVKTGFIICDGIVSAKYQPNIPVGPVSVQSRGGAIIRMDMIRFSSIGSGNLSQYPGEWRISNELESATLTFY